MALIEDWREHSRAELLGAVTATVDYVCVKSRAEGESSFVTHCEELSKFLAAERDHEQIIAEFTGFGQTMLDLMGYQPEQDIDSLVAECVNSADKAAAGREYGTEGTRRLLERMRRPGDVKLGSGFMNAIARGLRLSECDRLRLAAAYAYDEYRPPEVEDRPAS